MTTVTIKIGGSGGTDLIDNWIDDASHTSNNGADTKIRIGHDQSAGSLHKHGIITFKVPKIPSGAKITQVKLYLYKISDSNNGGGTLFPIYVNAMKHSFGELDSNWHNQNFSDAWTSSIAGDPGYFLSNEASAYLNLSTGWLSWDISYYINYYDLQGGDFVNVWIWGDSVSLPLQNDYLDFASRHYTTDTSKRPYLEVTIDSGTIIDLAIAPWTGNKMLPRLTWSPMGNVVRTGQNVYRRENGGAWAFVETIDKDIAEYIDDDIGTYSYDNTLIEYYIGTETAYNTRTGGNDYNSNIVGMKRPTVSTFYVASIIDGHEGANIDVQEPCGESFTATGFKTGGSISKYYIEWGDGGNRWKYYVGTTYSVHFYTTPGAKTVKARAENSDGWWSALYTTTAGHSAPAPVAIKPIARMDITPTIASPYDQITLDATRSYARCSDRTIGNKTFGAAGSSGLPAQPQAGPIATCYYKTTGTKSITLLVADSGALNSDQISKNISIANPSIVRFASFDETVVRLEEVTPSKDRSLDESPIIGTDGSEVIPTGARATKYQIQGSCLGGDAEKNLRIIEGWALDGKIVDLPVYDDDRVVTLVLRGYLQNFSRQIRGGEPFTKWFNVSVIVIKRLMKVVDEAVSYVSGVGQVANYPLADYDGDGDRVDDISVYTAVGGGGTPKTVSAVDYPSDSIPNGLREITLSDGAFTATGYTTYWYEVNK